MHKTDIKKLASNIESLAKKIQDQLDAGSDVLEAANELSQQNLILVFSLGEMYAESKKKPANYHNLRDKTGRFIKATVTANIVAAV